MATANTITRSNFAAKLRQSTQGRAGVPDGNIFFDTTNGLLELITVNELATIIDPTDGVTVIPNPLTNADKATMSALFGFENQERSVDETLRGFDRFIIDTGSYKPAGAYVMANGRLFAGTDHLKVSQSGVVQKDSAGTITNTYFGAKTLGGVAAGSQILYKFSASGVAQPFSSTGEVDELIEV